MEKPPLKRVFIRSKYGCFPGNCAILFAFFYNVNSNGRITEQNLPERGAVSYEKPTARAGRSINSFGNVSWQVLG